MRTPRRQTLLGLLHHLIVDDRRLALVKLDTVGLHATNIQRHIYTYIRIYRCVPDSEDGYPSPRHIRQKHFIQDVVDVYCCSGVEICEETHVTRCKWGCLHRKHAVDIPGGVLVTPLLLRSVKWSPWKSGNPALCLPIIRNSACQACLHFAMQQRISKWQ